MAVKKLQVHGLQGDDGVGISSIVQTKTSEESGGINEITVALTNGVTATFEVHNGGPGTLMTATELPENKIALANIMYFLGTISEIEVGFPEEARVGDMIFISFTSGETSTILNLTTENHVGIANLAINSNSYYELTGMWNGNAWVFVKYEVSV